jgi:hypothetical protein
VGIYLGRKQQLLRFAQGIVGIILPFFGKKRKNSQI